MDTTKTNKDAIKGGEPGQVKKIDPKKLILYSEIMKPKFEE